MSNDQTTNAERLASTEDIRAILGALEERELLEVVALRPTIGDLEKAAVWLSGDPDIVGAREPLKGVAGEIVDLLKSDEEDEAARMR